MNLLFPKGDSVGYLVTERKISNWRGFYRTTTSLYAGLFDRCQSYKNGDNTVTTTSKFFELFTYNKGEEDSV